MCIMNLVNTATNIGTFIGAIAAVVIAWRTMRADHERRKKQATIELTSWIDDDKLQQNSLVYCNKMDRLAISIEIGVYDFNTYCRVFGVTTIKLYDQLKPFIEENRKTNQKFCKEFENLYDRIELSRTKIERNSGEIKYSKL